MSNTKNKSWRDYNHNVLQAYPTSRNYKILRAYFHYHSEKITRGMNKILSDFINTKFTEHQKKELEQYYDEKIDNK